MDIPTQRDLFLVARRQALLGNTKFDPAIIDADGSDVNVVFNVAAAMGEEVARYLSNRLNAKSPGTARDEDLDRVNFDTYQLPRFGAQRAVVTLTLSRSGTQGFTVPEGSVFGDATGVTFETLNDVAFGANITGPLTTVAVAQQAGRSGNLPAGAITRVLTTQEDSTLTVVNEQNSAGGRDEETDEAYQARARRVFTSARRGTREALETGALDVGRVSQASAIEILDVATGLPGYRTQLFIADEDGQANTALANEVILNLDEYRCWGVPVLTTAATPQYEDIVATGLQFEAGADTTVVLNNAASALLAVVNSTLPGATLRRASLLGALGNVSQLIVPEGALVEPAGDLVPTAGTVIRTTRDRISLTG